MSKAGDHLVRCCNKLNRIPSLLLCFLVILAQDCIIDYYLINHLALTHFSWIVGDLLVLILMIVCFRLTSDAVGDVDGANKQSRNYTIVWVTWAVMQVILAAKVVIICTTFATELEEEKSFFGPNTLKTAIALGSCTFVLMLTSQHDSPPSSERRRYIEELTGTVVFDILDTADILDVLFDAEDRPNLSSGIPELILSVAVLNLLLPTVPLFTLSKTKFGLEKLRKRIVYLHRLLLVLAVNVPNLLARMILWHGFSVGISPFCLKNFILICMTAYEFYEHKKEKFEMHEKEAKEQEDEDIQNGNGTSDVKLRVFNRNSGDSYKRDSGDQARHSVESNDGIAHFDIESRMVTGR